MADLTSLAWQGSVYMTLSIPQLHLPDCPLLAIISRSEPVVLSSCLLETKCALFNICSHNGSAQQYTSNPSTPSIRAVALTSEPISSRTVDRNTSRCINPYFLAYCSISSLWSDYSTFRHPRRTKWSRKDGFSDIGMAVRVTS